MNTDFFNAATKAKTSKVIKCEKIQRTAEKLSVREFEGQVEVKINGDYEDKAASKLKKELSRNWAYSLYKIVTGSLLQWTDQNKTIEITPKNSVLENGLNKIYSGLSLDYFMNNIFGNALFNRFNDFVIVDKTEDGKLPVIFTVPINNVYDYKIIGSDVIYILYLYKTIIKDNKKVQLFRYYGVMDEMEGFYFVEIERNGLEISVSEPSRLRRDDLNFATNNTVRQVGSLLFDEMDFEIRESRIASIIDKMELYRREYDIRVISNIIHAFPEKITISIPCTNCEGTGRVEDSEGDFHTCNVCNGTGKWIAKKPTDITLVPIKIADQTKLAFPDMVKYVTKDIATLEFQSKTLKDLRAEIISDGTGISLDVAAGMKTATEIVENRIPLNSKLNTIITADVQPTFKWILDRVNEIWYGSLKFEASANYQKFYTGLASNSIMNELKQAKENELHSATKRQLEIDYINAKYADNIKVRDNLIIEILKEEKNGEQNRDLSKL